MPTTNNKYYLCDKKVEIMTCSHNYEITSRNYEIKSQNYDIPSWYFDIKIDNYMTSK